MTASGGTKSPFKVVAFSTGGIAALAALLWVGTFLYWKFRITSVLHQWETSIRTNPPGPLDSAMPRENAELLNRAGCRALPALVDAMNASADPVFQERAMDRIIASLMGPWPWDDRAFVAAEVRRARWDLQPGLLEFVRKEHLADFNAWWASNGQRFHQGWRVWSGWCLHE